MSSSLLGLATGRFAGDGGSDGLRGGRKSPIVLVESLLRDALQRPLITLPHFELWLRESVLKTLACPVLSALCKERRRSSAAILLLLPGRALRRLSARWTWAKCGVVVSGVVVVVAAMPLRFADSPEGIDRFIVRIDAASESRR